MEAENIVGKMADHAKPSRFRTYEPRAFNERTQGLEKKNGGAPWTDAYFGSGEAIVASGLAERNMLPGSPGVGVGCANYRPATIPIRRAHLAPGYISIFSRPGGRFRVELTVSLEEQARREAAEAAKSEAKKVTSASQPARQLLPESVAVRLLIGVATEWANAGSCSRETAERLIARLAQPRRRTLPAGWRVIAGGA